ncbi:TetR family transcriptional regulator [Gordonia sp. SID5947]|uniref:TetR/AcrR family transcriptional regulator n=1 Tax=Gordonia sp. SID5947 TaxID=2690315 RepID=UPI0031B9CFCA
MSSDWLIDGNRPDVARARLIACATDLIARRGVTKFDINGLARHAHCSRATVYRHAGGRAAIIEGVLAATSAPIITAVRTATTGLGGSDRARVAISVALRELREDRVFRQFLRSSHLITLAPTAVASNTVAALAAELIGIDPSETTSTEFAIRSFLTLLLWPAEPTEEDRLIGSMIAGINHR